MTPADTTTPIILCIDDSPPNLKLLNAILSKRYGVRAAISGELGLRIAKQQQPDLILLDIVMPEMSGFEVIRQLKCDSATRDIPVVFLSGTENAEDQARCRDLGAADYLIKPVKADVLLSKVESVLNDTAPQA